MYIIHTMKRTNIYFPEQQLEQLKALSAKTGLSVAELVRRSIDAYLVSELKNP